MREGTRRPFGFLMSLAYTAVVWVGIGFFWVGWRSESVAMAIVMYVLSAALLLGPVIAKSVIARRARLHR